MRFACDSCLTRYTLADEKVRGRVLKIRCKTCGKVMMVKDPALAEAKGPPSGEQATRAIDPAEAMRLAQGTGADADSWENQPTRSMPVAEAMRLAMSSGPAQAPAEWFAMRKGQQLGPMSVTELERQLAAGDLGPRTYVWREGMADWQRMEAVEELAALAAAAAGHFVPTPGPVAPEAPAPAPTPSASQLDAASLFDLPAAEGEATPVAAPAERQAPAIEAAPRAAPAARQGGPAGRSGEESGGGAWALQQGGTRPSTPVAAPAGSGSARLVKLVVAGVILAIIVAAGAYFLLPAAAAVQGGAAAPDAPRSGLVRIGDLPTAGYPPLGPVALRKALDTRIDGYQRCLADHPQAGKRPGRLVVRAVVAPSGAVTAASAEGGGSLGVCLADRTRDIRFPAFQGAPVEVAVPLELPAN